MKLRNILLCGAVVASCATGAGGAYAQSAPAASGSGNTLSEVVVTARKRSESLQKIPVAVSSFQGKQLAQQGLREVADLSKVVPSLAVLAGSPSTGGASVVFDIRDQTASDNLLEIASAIGLYEDGVNIPHAPGTNLSFFDISRVDVLKGPQGTLYGRNTTGGAINLITKGPDFNGYHGFAEAEFGNFNDVRVGGGVNIPLIDDVLAVRLAAQHWSREGIGYSNVTGQRLGDDKNDTTVRASAIFNPTSKISSQFQLEYDQADRNGELLIPVYDNGNADLEAGLESGATFTQGICPGANPPSTLLPFTCASLGAVGAAGNAALAKYVGNKNIFVNSQNQFGLDRIKVWHFGGTISYQITPDIQIKSITGTHYVLNYRDFDLDATPYQLLEINATPLYGTPSNYPQTPDTQDQNVSQEFDVSGKAFDDRIQWLAGLYGNWDSGRSGQFYTAQSDLIQAINTGFDNLQETPGKTYATPEGEHDADKVTNQSWAIFTQDDFKITQQFSVTLGFRYTEERLGQVLRDFTYDPGNGSYTCTATNLASPTGPAGCASGSSAKYSGISYLASLNYQITPSILAYLKTSRGFKGGALQGRAPGFAAAAPEYATDWEFGLKGEYFDRRLRANLDVYQTHYENLQESTILEQNSNTYTVVTNAGSAQIQGFEGDVTAIPIHNLSIYGTMTYTGGHYLSYSHALTPNGNYVNASGEDITNANTGDPRWRYSVGARYEYEVGPGKLGVEGDWSWHSAGILNEVNEDTTVANPALLPGLIAVEKNLFASVGLLNGRVDYAIPSQGVTISLFGTNLLDKHYLTPGLQGAAIGGITTATVQDPRMYGITFRKAFGGE